MDGRQCLQQIRANRRYDLLPIVIYTAIEDHNVIEFTFRHGANLYTLKPSTIDELSEVLRRIFSIDWKKSMYYPALPDFVIRA
jgi:DNA-binding NarL/FixJ family response regulator